jgi:uncharacterized SAM-binding protein YcdF (DUF218 family)
MESMRKICHILFNGMLLSFFLSFFFFFFFLLLLLLLLLLLFIDFNGMLLNMKENKSKRNYEAKGTGQIKWRKTKLKGKGQVREARTHMYSVYGTWPLTFNSFLFRLRRFQKVPFHR